MTFQIIPIHRKHPHSLVQLVPRQIYIFNSFSWRILLRDSVPTENRHHPYPRVSSRGMCATGMQVEWEIIETGVEIRSRILWNVEFDREKCRFWHCLYNWDPSRDRKTTFPWCCISSWNLQKMHAFMSERGGQKTATCSLKTKGGVLKIKKAALC